MDPIEEVFGDDYVFIYKEGKEEPIGVMPDKMAEEVILELTSVLDINYHTKPTTKEEAEEWEAERDERWAKKLDALREKVKEKRELIKDIRALKSAYRIEEDRQDIYDIHFKLRMISNRGGASKGRFRRSFGASVYRMLQSFSERGIDFDKRWHSGLGRTLEEKISGESDIRFGVRKRKSGSYMATMDYFDEWDSAFGELRESAAETYLGRGFSIDLIGKNFSFSDDIYEKIAVISKSKYRIAKALDRLVSVKPIVRDE